MSVSVTIVRYKAPGQRWYTHPEAMQADVADALVKLMHADGYKTQTVQFALEPPKTKTRKAVKV